MNLKSFLWLHYTFHFPRHLVQQPAKIHCERNLLNATNFYSHPSHAINADTYSRMHPLCPNNVRGNDSALENFSKNKKKVTTTNKNISGRTSTRSALRCQAVTNMHSHIIHSKAQTSATIYVYIHTCDKYVYAHIHANILKRTRWGQFSADMTSTQKFKMSTKSAQQKQNQQQKIKKLQQK